MGQIWKQSEVTQFFCVPVPLPSLESSYNLIYIRSLSTAITIFAYTKIFLSLLHNQILVQNHEGQPSQAIPLNIARYRKAVPSTLCVQVSLRTTEAQTWVSEKKKKTSLLRTLHVTPSTGDRPPFYKVIRVTQGVGWVTS